MAIILLSIGWKARYVEAGGGDMNVVITYKKVNYKLQVNLATRRIMNIQLSSAHTLNVIMLNKETFPPHADITYESFFESAMQGTASSRLTPETSLVIRRPLLGCQCCGTALADA